MNLIGNRRGGTAELAVHLMNVEDNEHVHIHELRGFIADDLDGAFHEAYGISRGTRCRKFLYSLSLNPSASENVPVSVFEAAIERIEEKLRFTGQPRAIVFHEKRGRRHAHVVWSRINAANMTAIDPYQDKLSLNHIGRELFLEHGWNMPDGYRRREDADPLNYTHAEHQQAKRTKHDAKDLKRIFRECWERSDSKASFASSLKEHGLILARGDRRWFVGAVDAHGEIYAIARWAGVKTKEVRTRLGLPDNLPGIEEALKQFDVGRQAQSKPSPAEVEHHHKLSKLKEELSELVLRHRAARSDLEHLHETRRLSEIKSRSGRLPIGLRAIWLRLSGGYKSLRHELERQASQCVARDRDEVQALIDSQLTERRALQQEITAVQSQISNFVNAPDEQDTTTRFLQLDPAQALVIPPDPDAQTIKQRVQDRPETILEAMTQTRENFTRNDILRSLAQYIDDPLKLGSAINAIMQSPELVEITADGDDPVSATQNTASETRSDVQFGDTFKDNNSQFKAQPKSQNSFTTTANVCYSTREFQSLKADLMEQVGILGCTTSTFVSSRTIHAAIKQRSRVLKSEINATLSEQQEQAIHHCLQAKQLSALIGLAGTGKSTILSAVKSALERQGYTVHGAALAGKAVDGLEQASNIKSRTLASWVKSWGGGYSTLTSNDVLIIDEAGMIGTRQLSKFIKECTRTGAKLILVGDPEQLQPINAGTPFRDICNQINPARLTEIHRQQEQWQKQASLDLAEQRTEKALNAYEAYGKIKQTRDTSKAILNLVEDYMADLELNGNKTSRLALTHRRKDVHAINQAIRNARKSSGELTNEALISTDHGKRAFAKGDRIVFTQNNRLLNIKNGMFGTVTKIMTKENDVETLTIRLDGDGAKTITINPEHYTALDHGYATTIHKSQGATVDNAYILGSTTMDRHLTYVVLTRHKHNMRLYGDERSISKMKQSDSSRNQEWQKRAKQQQIHVRSQRTQGPTIR